MSASPANQLTNQASLSGGGALTLGRTIDLTIIAAGGAVIPNELSPVVSNRLLPILDR